MSAVRRAPVSVVALMCGAVTALGGGAGCQAESPAVDAGFVDALQALDVYADVVVAYTGQDGVLVTCTDEVPTCDGAGVNACEDSPVLGAPDNATLTIPPNGRIELGFLCRNIVERGPDTSGGLISPDFKLWSTIDNPGSDPNTVGVVVEVSEDGMLYRPLTTVGGTNPELELERLNLAFVRFVRVTADANSSFSIDALEILR